jgi:hypothetical protein
MTPGLREYKQATLRVAVPLGVPEHMRHGMRELVSIRTKNPRKGHATHLMHDVCAEADRLGFVLLLQVKPFDEGMTEEQLEKWYERFGFLEIQQEPVLMARQPRPTIQ